MTTKTVLKAIGLALLVSTAPIATASASSNLPAIFAGSEAGAGIYIDAAYLAGLSAQPGVKIIDIREADVFAQGHIPGAINIPNGLLSIDLDHVRNEIPPVAELQATFAAAGLSYDDTIVIYGDTIAGRAFIAFDQSGFEKVHVLEGGIAAWTGETTTVATLPTPSDFVLDREKVAIVDKDYVLAAIGQPDVFIIDSRGAEGYNAGFIPGSHNVPLSLSHNGAALQSPAALVAALDALGITKDSEIIATCGSGNAASNQLAVLRDLGYTNLKLYDGSWNDWKADPATPKGVNG